MCIGPAHYVRMAGRSFNGAIPMHQNLIIDIRENEILTLKQSMKFKTFAIPRTDKKTAQRFLSKAVERKKEFFLR